MCCAVLWCCGVQYHNGCSCYTDEGRLANNELCGVMECDPDCQGPEGGDSSSCKVPYAWGKEGLECAYGTEGSCLMLTDSSNSSRGWAAAA